jgi:hypothetical protein
MIRHPSHIQQVVPVPRRRRVPDMCATAEPQVPALFRGRVSPSVPQELSTLFCGVHAQEPLGLPTFLCASLPACHGLRTPADLSLLAYTDGLVLPSVCVKTLGGRHKRLSKLYQHFRGRGHPCGRQDALSPLRPSCSP